MRLDGSVRQRQPGGRGAVGRGLGRASAQAFLPWLATFRLQARPIGTPWHTPPTRSSVPQTVLGWCGTSLPGWSLTSACSRS